MLTPDWLEQLGNALLIGAVFCFFAVIWWLVRRWYANNESAIDARAYAWRKKSPVVSLIAVLSVGALAGAAIAAAIWFVAIANKPEVKRYSLHFAMLMDPKARSVGDPIQLDFRLVNVTRPSDEIHNIFGILWIDGEFVVAASLLPRRGQAGIVGRIEWDIQAPVIPKDGFFVPPTIHLKMPPSGKEIMVGARFVSKQTEAQEYLWKIENDGRQTKRTIVRDGNANEK